VFHYFICSLVVAILCEGLTTAEDKIPRVATPSFPVRHAALKAIEPRAANLMEGM